MFRGLSPPHLLLAGYCAGLMGSLALRPPPAVVAAAGVAVALAVLAGRGRSAAGPGEHRRAGRLIVLCGLTSLAVLAGLAVGGWRLVALERSALRSSVGHAVDLRATLSDLPQAKGGAVTLALTVTAVDGREVREPAHLRLLLADGQQPRLDSSGPLVEGVTVSLSGVRVEPLPAPRPGAFDYGRYLRRRGEHVMLSGRWPDLTITGRRGGLAGFIDGLRGASRAHLRVAVRPPVSEILQGMVLGDDEGVDARSIDDFRRSGLLHIMAVSGENVVLLCGMWAFALTLFAVPRLVRTLMLIPLVVTYVVLTGASPSIVRAGVSGVLGLLAILASRQSDGWLFWLAPAAWLLTANPQNLHDVSFQLSFAAVAGLLLLARRLTRLFSFLPGPLPEQAGVTAAASLATAPVSMLAFGSVSLVSVPANLVGGFVLAPIMFLGMLSLVVGCVSPWLSAPLNALAGVLAGFLLTAARAFGRPTWAVWEWHGLNPPLLLVCALVAEALAVAWLAVRAGERPVGYVLERERRRPLLALTAGLLALVLIVAPRGPSPPPVPTLTFFDVGEGAAALLQAPGGRTILVDAGPAPLARTLREHAVRRIDLLVLSHGHADHTAGLSDVLGHINIAVALLPRPPEGSALPGIARALAAAGTEVRWCSEPTQLDGGAWGLRVIPSEPAPGEGGNQGENDSALVVVARLGGDSVLLPGDCEAGALRRLNLPPCTVVGVPHHGSRGGLEAPELRRLAPRLAVVSVGPNTYGHPTSEMLGVLAAHGVPCVRTDRAGNVVVSLVAGRLRAAAERVD